MALAIVQQRQNYAAATSVALAYTTDPTAGNLLIAVVRVTSVLANTSIDNGFSLAKSAIWRKSANRALLIYFKVSDGSETGDITVTTTDSTSSSIQLAEFSGMPNAIVDKTANVDSDASDTGVTSRSSGTTDSTTADEEIAIAAWAQSNSVSSWSCNNGFTLFTNLNTVFMSAYKLLSSMAAQETTLSWSTSTNAGGVIATFKAGSTGIAIPVIANQFRMRRE